MTSDDILDTHIATLNTMADGQDSQIKGDMLRRAAKQAEKMRHRLRDASATARAEAAEARVKRLEAVLEAFHDDWTENWKNREPHDVGFCIDTGSPVSGSVFIAVRAALEEGEK